MTGNEAIEIMINRKLDGRMAEFKALTGFSYENFKKLFLAGIITIKTDNGESRSIYDLMRICDGGMVGDYIKSTTEQRKMAQANMLETLKRYDENLESQSQSKIDKKDDE
jgi:hypothetical protein